MPKETTHKHPSYGVIRISRTSGGDDVLFGSSIRHQHKVHMTISTAELIRDDLHYDRHFPRNSIIEIEMSQSQFAEFITSMNLGAGVPCTIRRMGDGKSFPKGVESCPTTPKREQFESEFKGQIDELTQEMSSLVKDTQKILEKKSILKADRVEIQDRVNSLEAIIKSHIPFMVGMWNEQMDKTVEEAKGEVEAFTEHTLTQAGLAAAHKKLEESGHNLIELEALPPPKEK